MKLLITTQVLDSQDSNLGFFHRWVEEFAKECEQVTVICLREGVHALPNHVRVLSLGKPSSAKVSQGAAARLLYIVRFYRYIYRYRKEYDAVFVHMNPEYVVLGGYLWHRWAKRIGLWYAHKSITPRLKRAVRLVDRVFTVSENSFRIATPKLCVVGHGIDTEIFKPAIHLESTATRIITFGRVAESKHILEMLSMLDILYARGENFTFTIVGDSTTTQEEQYLLRVKEEIKKRPYEGKIHFLGAVAHNQLPQVLHEQDLCLNFSTTGNMDKAGLEALAAGVPLFSTNEAFETLLAPFDLHMANPDPQKLAAAVEKFLNRPDRPAVISILRNKVVTQHSLSNLIPKIVRELCV